MGWGSCGLLVPVNQPATKPSNNGYCWWGWAHSHGHGNPRFWQASWAYSKEQKGATHWAPHWTFPVIK